MPDLAHHITVDHDTHRVTIDGHVFPFHLNERGPNVSSVHGARTAVVWLPVLADSVTVTRRGTITTTGTADYGAEARQIVRDGLALRLPWLRLCEEAA